MADNLRERGVSVTLKRQGKDQPWIVFTGTVEEVRQDICAAVGIETQPTLARTVVQAQQAFETGVTPLLRASQEPPAPVEPKPAGDPVEAVVEALDGEVISIETTDDPWDEGPAEPTALKDPLIEAINAAESKAELRAVFLAHKDRFNEPEVTAAAKKRSEELSG